MTAGWLQRSSRLKRSVLSLLLLIGILACSQLHAENSVETQKRWPSVIPEGMGVNIHTHRGVPSLKDIQDTGFRVVRKNLYWDSVEKQRGKYDWGGYDRLIGTMERHSLRPLLVLGLTNALYEPATGAALPSENTKKTTRAPVKPETINAFVAYAEEAARHYKYSSVIWEIWNEPDYIDFWPPQPNVETYTKMAERACRAIKKADPTAVVIGPSSAGTPAESGYAKWWDGFLKSSALSCFDAVSFHPYVRDTNKGPEINIRNYAHIRKLLKEHKWPDLPLINSEFGFSTSDWNVSRERQAALFVRNYLLNLMEGLPVSIWYDWQDDGEDPKNREHNFGLITKKGEKKQIAHAARTLVNLLNGYRFDKRIEVKTKEAEVFLLKFKKEKSLPVYVAWTNNTRTESKKIMLPIQKEQKDLFWKIASTTGEVLTPLEKEPNIVIPLSEYPIYLSQVERTPAQ